jgi:RHS repeat-associated protein
VEYRTLPALGSVVLLAFVLLSAPPALAAEEGLQELRPRPLAIEWEVEPVAASELPPRSYPVEPVEQLPFHGAWHEFVNVTTGGLVFRMADLRLPGRMPLDFGRIYDSKISDSLPPPPPGGPAEARWDEDLGKNWILGFTAYLIPAGTGFNMATTDGDVVRWAYQGSGVWKPLNGTASKHLVLEQDGTGLVETQADGTRWTFSYGVASGSTHGLTKIEDRSGNTIEMVYGMGRLVEIKNSDDSSITLHRENVNPGLFPVTRVTRIADDTGRELHFDYDVQGLLTSVTDVLGHVWTFAYGLNKKLTSATDPLGNVYLTASYNAQHRVASYAGPNGPWSFTYSGYRTLADDAFGKRWEYEHAGAGITTEITEPEGGVHTLTLDSSKNPAGYVDPEGVAVSWTYNADHLPTSYTPAGVAPHAILYQYHATEHWVTSVIGLDGGVTAFVRDAAGRVTEEIKPDGGKWTATYDPARGDRLTLTLPLGNVPGGTGYDWSFEHDAFGQIVAATDPTGRVFEFEYTAAGDLWKFRRPDHHDTEQQLVQAEWTYGRDAAGRITAITDPLGHTWTRTYDAAGRLVAIEGPAGTRVEYGHDARHRITSATVVDGVTDPVTTYTWDAAGRLASKTLPDGASWSYGWDDASRLVSVTDPLARTWTYTRDLAGRVTSLTHPGGQVVTLERDAAGRLATRTYPGGRVESFTYDSTTGRLVSAEADVDTGAWIGRLDWAYDLMGRPESVKTTIADGAGTQWRELALGYDVNGNRTSLVSSPIGETIGYDFDELDRLIGTTSTLYDDWTVTYDPDSGHRTSVSAADRSRNWTYDLAGRMTSQVWDWPGQATGSLTYTHDEEGRPATIDDLETGTVEVFEWNALNLPVQHDVLAGADSSSTTIVYDVAGRQTGRTRTLGSETTEWVFDRDAAGRLVYARQDDEIRTYQWDDAPAAPGAVLRVWRTPTDPRQAAVEVLYGFDGRVHEVYRQEAGASPALTARYRWSPLVAAVAFEATEQQVDATTATTRIVADVGGPYGQVDEDFADLALVTPVSGVDHSVAALWQLGGVRVPDVAAPFGRGAWGGLDRRPSESETAAIAAFVTGLVRGANERGMAAAEEARVAVGLGTLADPRVIPPDLSDDWLNGPLLGGGPLLAGSAVLAQDAGASAGSPGDPSPDGIVVPPEAEGCWHELCVAVPETTCVCQGGYIMDLTGEQAPVYTCCDGPGGGALFPFDLSQCDFEFDLGTTALESRRSPDFSEGGVSLTNGAYVKSVTDLSVFGGGVGAIAFTRTYHSLAKHFGVLGYRWTHNWEEKIVIGTDADHPEECGQIARWVSADGGYTDFRFEENGTIDYPPDSLHRIRKVPAGSQTATSYEIRSVSGAVRVFTQTDEATYRLSEVRDGDNLIALSYHPTTGLLTHVGANGAPRLALTYGATTHEGDPLLTRVENALDPDHWVAFDYDLGEPEDPGCYELTAVTLPPTALEAGATPVARSVHYTYDNLNAADCRTSASGMHLLTATSVDQLDPLGGPPGLQRTVTNAYYLPPEVPWNLIGTVRWQCLGNEPDCTEAEADFLYEYEHEGADRATIETDRRIDGAPTVTRHEFNGDGLWRRTEDVGGLERVTTYAYAAPGVLSGTTYHDGSGIHSLYSEVAGILLPVTTYRYSADPSQLPQITHRTYEGFMGRVRTITGPAAFAGSCSVAASTRCDEHADCPGGEVCEPASMPLPFDPEAEGIREHTEFFVYDFDEGIPLAVAAQCDAWQVPCDCWPNCPSPPNPFPMCDLPCPSTTLADLNGDTGDDSNWYGNPIKTYRWLPADPAIGREEHELATTTTYLADGRPKKTTGPDGVATELVYYDDPGLTSPPLWDWRSGGTYGDPGDPTPHDGPVALTRVVPTDTEHPSLESLQAWSAKHEPVAARDATGVRSETTYSAAGEVLSQRITCDVSINPACDPENDVLRTTRHTYDLRGRRVREQIFDGAVGEGELPLAETRTTYDDFGRPTSVTVDPAGGATAPPQLNLVSKSFYDGRGRVTKVVSPEGRVSCNTYDALDRLTAVRRRANLDDNTPNCGSSPDDIVSTVQYDALDRPIAQTDGAGVSTYLWYDGFGRPELTSDGAPAGAWPPALLSGAFSPPAAKWYADTLYDAAGRAVRSRFFGRRDPEDTDPEAHGFMQVSWRTYDELGRAVEGAVAVADGYVPDSAATSTTAVVETGMSLVTSRQLHDLQGRPHRVEDTFGRATDQAFDGFGRVYLTTAPVERVCENSTTSCLLDADCAAAGLSGPCIDEPGGPRDTQAVEFDDFGRPWRTVSTVHDPTGAPRVREATSQYDAWGRVVRSVGAPAEENLITDTAYDALGRAVRRATRWQTENWSELPALDDHDRATRYSFDNAGRLCKVEQRRTNGNDWVPTETGFDDDGLTSWLRDANGNQTDWTHDPLGRVAKMRYPLENGLRQTVEYVDYLADRPERVALRDDDGSSTALYRDLGYDERGRVSSIVADTDSVGSLTLVGSTARAFVYDDLGRLIKATDTNLDCSAETALDSFFTYDSVGRTIEENQPRRVGTETVDHVVRSWFDAQGARTKLEFPQAYDELGAPQPLYAITFQTDSLGRLAAIRAPGDPADAGSPPTSLVEYDYAGGQVWSRRYRNGAELRMYDDGAIGHDPWDGLGRPTALRTVNAADPQQVITDFRYGFDRVGNLTHEQRLHEPVTVGQSPAEGTYRTRAFTTDLLGRLAAWNEGDLGLDPIPPAATDPAGLLHQQSGSTDAESWMLDPLGNWEQRTQGVGGTTTAFATNPLNQYTEIDSTPGDPGDEKALTFDWLGQLVQDETKHHEYRWDAFGRLSEIRDTSDTQSELVARYRYDAFNRRVEKHAPSELDDTTRYVYDGWRAIEERALSVAGDWEAVRARYGFGQTLDGVLWMDRDLAKSIDQVTQLPVPDPTGGVTDNVIEGRFFAHHDHLGSVVALTEDASVPGPIEVAERFTYSAYGEVSAWWEPGWTATGYSGGNVRSRVGLPYLFTGQRLDGESGLQYFKNRLYNPAAGRFLRRDPVGYTSGPSLYLYSNATPHTNVDPLGLTYFDPNTGTKDICGYLCNTAGSSSSGSGRYLRKLHEGPYDLGTYSTGGLEYKVTATVIQQWLGQRPLDPSLAMAGYVAAARQRAMDTNPLAFWRQLAGDFASNVADDFATGGAAEKISAFEDGVAQGLGNVAEGLWSLVTTRPSKTIHNAADAVGEVWGYGVLRTAKEAAVGFAQLSPNEMAAGIGQLTGDAAGVIVVGGAAGRPARAARGATRWGNPRTLARHFRDHGADFGARTADEYAGLADDFLGQAQRGGLPTKVGPDGTIRAYDPATNTFGSFNPDGTTKTFFKPDPSVHGYPTNLDYWNAQPGAPPWTP